MVLIAIFHQCCKIKRSIYGIQKFIINTISMHKTRVKTFERVHNVKNQELKSKFSRRKKFNSIIDFQNSNILL
jgi:hypothetical protein